MFVYLFLLEFLFTCGADKLWIVDWITWGDILTYVEEKFYPKFTNTLSAILSSGCVHFLSQH